MQTSLQRQAMDDGVLLPPLDVDVVIVTSVYGRKGAADQPDAVGPTPALGDAAAESD